MTPRFFVPPEWLGGEKALLHDEVAHRIRHVLRLGKGDKLTLLDDSGWEYEAEITSLGSAVEVRLGERRLSPNEPKARVLLFVSLLKGDKLEFVLQKGTELGVKEFFPVLSEGGGGRAPGKKKFE